MRSGACREPASLLVRIHPRDDAAPYAKYSGVPNVVVEKMPGAGEIIGTNYVYSKAKPDGLTALFATGTPINQLIELPGIEFDVGTLRPGPTPFPISYTTWSAPRWAFRLGYVHWWTSGGDSNGFAYSLRLAW